jgi:hypothetical protein
MRWGIGKSPSHLGCTPFYDHFHILRRHGCRVLRWPTSGLPQAWLPGGRMSGVPEADGRVSLSCSISITRVSAGDRGRQVTRTLSERAAHGVRGKLHCARPLPIKPASDCLPVCFQQAVPTTLGTRNQTVSQRPARRRHLSVKGLSRALACRNPAGILSNPRVWPALLLVSVPGSAPTVPSSAAEPEVPRQPPGLPLVRSASSTSSVRGR